MGFVTLTPENLANQHLCCIIRRKKPHPGVEAKRAWLAHRLAEGHVFRKLDDEKACCFMEYAPLETAWVPVEGENYLYIYCLWVTGDVKGKGLGRALMEACLAQAKAQGKSGLCMLGAKKQKAWLSNQAFAEKFGFREVDAAGEYRLLALSLDGSLPRFTASAKAMRIDHPELTLYYDDQCPFILQKVEEIRRFCQERSVPLQILKVDSVAAAKALPCPFNNFAMFYRGAFVTVNLPDTASVEKLLKKE